MESVLPAMDRFFTRVATQISTAVGQPLAFLLAAGVVVVWAVTGPLFNWSDTWQLVINTGTSLATFLMVFLIQNSQNRDAAAMQAKLDELLRALEQARSQFIGVEHLTDAEIEKIRGAIEKETGNADENGKAATVEESVEQLLKRR